MYICESVAIIGKDYWTISDIDMDRYGNTSNMNIRAIMSWGSGVIWGLESCGKGSTLGYLLHNKRGREFPIINNRRSCVETMFLG